MSHFEPFDFTINLDFPRNRLETDGVHRSVLIHEYVHYLQCLSSTIGRCFLFELSRLAILAGHWHSHAGNPPELLTMINLDSILSSSQKPDYLKFPFQQQYSDIKTEVDALLNPHLAASPPGKGPTFIQRKLHGFPSKVLTHLELTYGGGALCVPLTDRVFFENAARQVQHHYLFMAIQNTSSVDCLEGQSGESMYRCLYHCIEPTLRGRFDAREMTIAISQFCLLSAEPGRVFELALDVLNTSTARTMEDQFLELRRTSAIAALMNQPDMGGIISELGRLQTSISSPASLELFQFRELIVGTYNKLNDIPWLFASSIVTWKTFMQWVRTFGCPEIHCSDGSLTDLEGVPCQSPWVKYLQQANERLS